MIRVAGILIIATDGKALFLKRGPGSDCPGMWCVPGGRLDGDETALEAAIRECKEECGYEVDPAKLVLWTRRIGSCMATGEGATIAGVDGEVDYTTFILQGIDPFVPLLGPTNSPEHVAYAWAPTDQPPEPLHPGCLIALQRISMDELGVARAIMSGDLTSPQHYENVDLFDIRITGTGGAYRTSRDEHVWRDPSIYLNGEFLARCNGLPVIMEHPKKAVLNSREFADRVIGTVFLPYLKNDEVWGIAKIYDAAASALMEERQLSTSPSVVFLDPSVNSKLKLENGSTFLIEGKPSLLDHIAICEQGVWDKGGDPTGVISRAIGDSEMPTPEEEKARKDAEEARAKADAETGKKLDKLLTGLDAMSKRMDALEERDRKDQDDDARRRKDDDARRRVDDDERKFRDAVKRGDAKKKGPLEGFEEGGVFHPIRGSAGYSKRKAGDSDEEYKSRHDAEEEGERKALEEVGEPKELAADRAMRHRKDAEEEEEREASDRKRKDAEEKEEREAADRRRKDDDDARRKADSESSSALQKQIDDLRAKLPAQLSDEDRAKFADEQARADSVLSMNNERAPAPLLGETLTAYAHRLTGVVKQHAPKWKATDTLKIADAVAFANVQSLIYADATESLRHPTGISGGSLKMIEKRLASGHTERSFVGDSGAWVGMFSGNGQIAKSITPRGRA